jgi:alkylation response protein AidB-like acyl-CoA dehydrogenase
MTVRAPLEPRDFGFGEDESLLADLARKFLDEQLPVDKLRNLVARDPEAVYDRGERTDWDPGLWKQLVELGWSGLAVPERHGGAGFSLVGIAGLVEQVGRHALPSPLIASLNATLVLREAEGAAASAWLTKIANGAPASLALTDARGSWDPEDGDVTATREGEQLRLDGTAFFVQDAFKAELLVVKARLASESVLCVLPANTEGVSLEQNHIHDLTRDQATVRFAGVRVTPEQIVSRDAVAALRAAWPALLVVVSADLCGGSEWLLQTTVEYAKNRTQFDRAIGFFQAVKHPLVNGMIRVDRARSLLYSAACCVDVKADRSERAARMAKSAASDAGAFLSDRAVQLHGGIGFTWESDVHIFFKRSMHDQALYGDGVHQRRKLADDLIGPIETSA